MRKLASNLGISAAIAHLALIAIFYFRAGSMEGESILGTLVVVIGFSLPAILAAYGAKAFSPSTMFAAFAVSFFPGGLYLLRAPSIFRMIGVSHFALPGFRDHDAIRAPSSSTYFGWSDLTIPELSNQNSI